MGYFLSEKHLHKANQEIFLYYYYFECAQYNMHNAKATGVTGCLPFPALSMEALEVFILQTFGAKFGANKLYKSCAKS